MKYIVIMLLRGYIRYKNKTYLINATFGNKKFYKCRCMFYGSINFI